MDDSQVQPGLTSPIQVFQNDSDAPTQDEAGKVNWHNYDKIMSNLPSTFGEKLSASVQESMHSASTANLSRYVTESIIEDGLHNRQKVDPQELNRQYPGMDVPFSQPTNQVIAQYRYQQMLERKRTQATIEAGPSGPVLSTVNFLAAMVPHALDPVNYAAGAIIGPLVKGVSALQGASLAARTANAGINNLAGNAVGEATNYIQSQEEMKNYSLKDAAANVIGGAAVGTALHVGVGSLARQFGLIKDGPKMDLLESDAASKQAGANQKVDLGPLIKDMQAERAGIVKPEFVEKAAQPYERINTNDPDTYQHSSWYYGSENARGSYAEAPKTHVEVDLGPGNYLTDNKAVANGHAGSKYLDEPGTIHQLELKDTKLLDIEQKPIGDVKASLETILGEEVPQEMSIKEVLGSMSHEEIAKFEGQLLEKGVHGYSLEGGNLAEGAPKQNVIKMFDPENTGTSSGKISEVGQIKPNPEAVHAMSPDELLAIKQDRVENAYKYELDYDPKAHAELQANLENMPVEPREAGMKDLIDMNQEALDTQEKMGLVHPDDVKAVEQASLYTKFKDMAQRFMTACLTLGD